MASSIGKQKKLFVCFLFKLGTCCTNLNKHLVARKQKCLQIINLASIQLNKQSNNSITTCSHKICLYLHFKTVFLSDKNVLFVLFLSIFHDINKSTMKNVLFISTTLFGSAVYMFHMCCTFGTKDFSFLAGFICKTRQYLSHAYATILSSLIRSLTTDYCTSPETTQCSSSKAARRLVL